MTLPGMASGPLRRPVRGPGGKPWLAYGEPPSGVFAVKPNGYRYYRMGISATAGSAITQLSEWAFYADSGKANRVLASAATWGVAPVQSYDGPPSNLNDGNAGTKICAGNIGGDGGPGFAGFSFVFDYGAPVVFAAYNWMTSGDTVTYPNRNPRTWTIEGSNDGITWVTIETKTVLSLLSAANNTWQVGWSLTYP